MAAAPRSASFDQHALQKDHCTKMYPACMHNCYPWSKHEKVWADIPTAGCLRAAAPDRIADAGPLRTQSVAAGMLPLGAVFSEGTDEMLLFSDDTLLFPVLNTTFPVCALVPSPARALHVSV